MSLETLSSIRKIVFLYLYTVNRHIFSRKWSEWLLSPMHRFEKEAALLEVWKIMLGSSKAQPAEIEQAYSHLVKRMSAEPDLDFQSKPFVMLRSRTVNLDWRTVRQYAAVIVILALPTAATYYYLNRQDDTQQLDVVAELVVENEPVPFRQPEPELRIGSNARRVKCPDGSEIWSNASGNVDYYAGRSAKTNGGEVYFEVAKAETAAEPFVVISGAVKAIVLGTRFTVFEDENQIKYMLHEGQLDIHTPNVDVQLLAGRTLVYNKATADVSYEQLKAFVPGFVASSMLRFNKSNFAEIFSILSKYFNVRIIHDRQYWDQKLVTLRLNGTETLPQILEMIELIEPAFYYHITADGSVIVG